MSNDASATSILNFDKMNVGWRGNARGWGTYLWWQLRDSASIDCNQTGHHMWLDTCQVSDHQTTCTAVHVWVFLTSTYINLKYLAMENGPFEDVFPSWKWDFPASHVSLPEGKTNQPTSTNQVSHGTKVKCWASDTHLWARRGRGDDQSYMVMVCLFSCCCKNIPRPVFFDVVRTAIRLESRYRYSFNIDHYPVATETSG